MKTDTLFYRLFLQRPELIFELTGISKPNHVVYRFQSVEVKQAALRLDGVFMPVEDQSECPLIFTEVQYQKDSKIYARLFSEISLYLYQKDPVQDWQAVLIFPNPNCDPGISMHYREFFDSGRIQVVYLNQLPQKALGLGVQLIRLIEVNDALVPEQLKHIKSAILASPQNSQNDWLELLETILVYKLPRLSRDEVKTMLSDILNVELKQTRFYQDVFSEGQLEGRQKGRQEGRQQECIDLITRQIRYKLGAHPHIEQALQQLTVYSIESLEELAEALLSFQGLPDFISWLEAHKPNLS